MSQPRNGDDQFSLAELTPPELAGLASAGAQAGARGRNVGDPDRL